MSTAKIPVCLADYRATRSDQFDAIADIGFDAEAIDLADLPTANTINNPLLISLRIAAVALCKTKGELMDVVAQLDKDEAFDEVMARMQVSEDTFFEFVGMLREARGRIAIAQFAAVR